MSKKKILVCVLIVVAVLLALILVVISVGGSQENRLERGYDYLDNGDYEKAREEFDKILEKNEDLEEGGAIDRISFDSMIGSIKCDIGAGLDSAAERSIRELFEVFDNYDIDYSKEGIEFIAQWLALNGQYGDSLEADVSQMVEIIPELKDYLVWGELLYEDEEPYREYKVLYIGGQNTGKFVYTGAYATVEWRNEGYETEAPYKEYEVKYFNGVSTGEVRYTGKTKPVVKKYKYPTCFICGYSAALPPSGHPGHGLEGLSRFERGQNEDGTWGFWIE